MTFESTGFPPEILNEVIFILKTDRRGKNRNSNAVCIATL
jgi:hypothetical protein